MGVVVKEVVTAVPDSTDPGGRRRIGGRPTAAEAVEAGAEVVSNPFNLGVGGAMRVGFRVARGPRLSTCWSRWTPTGSTTPVTSGSVAALDDEPGPQVVIGARFAGVGDIAVPRAAPRGHAPVGPLPVAGHPTRLTDVTSGFRAHNRAGIELFARHYPADYLSDTVESLIIVADAGGRVHQVPVTMRPRLAGSPSQSPLRAAVYLLRVVAVLILSVFRRHSNPNRHEGRRPCDRSPHHRPGERPGHPHRHHRAVATAPPHEKYAIVWLVVALVIAVFAVFPGLFNSLAHSFGVKNPPDLLTVWPPCSCSPCASGSAGRWGAWRTAAGPWPRRWPCCARTSTTGRSRAPDRRGRRSDAAASYTPWPMIGTVDGGGQRLAQPGGAGSARPGRSPGSARGGRPLRRRPPRGTPLRR